MRYIGSKNLLLEYINQTIYKNISESLQSFCDIFSGTSIVAKFFKENYQIISNDLLFFSFTLQHATIENNRKPKFKYLNKEGINDPLEFLNNTEVTSINLKNSAFVHDNYSPTSSCDRQYFTNENALKIDFIRQTIEEWKQEKLINSSEYYYLIAVLIEAIPFVSNIAGTYGAYLKHWDNRAYKKIDLRHLEIINNNKKNRCFNQDSNELIKEIEGDVLYIDPPYNSRQYLPNYHILETIARYDSPEIYGKTGLRPYEDLKSKYCLKNEVYTELENLIKFAKFKYIIVSYSSMGILNSDEIEEILKKYGQESTFKLQKIPYRSYKRIKEQANYNLEEYIFFIKKL